MASTSAAAIPILVPAFKKGDRVFFKEYSGIVTNVQADAVVKYKFEIMDESPSYPKGKVLTRRGDTYPFVSMDKRVLIENSIHHVDIETLYGSEKHFIKIIEVIPHVVSDNSVIYTVKLDNPNTYPDHLALGGDEAGFKYVLAHDGDLTLIAEGGRRRRRRATRRRKIQRRRASKTRHRR